MKLADNIANTRHYGKKLFTVIRGSSTRPRRAEPVGSVPMLLPPIHHPTVIQSHAVSDCPIQTGNTVLLTQKPARARCLEIRRKSTKVVARIMSAIIVPRILSPWSACRLKPGWWRTAGGGPDTLDGPDMVGSMKRVGLLVDGKSKVWHIYCRTQCIAPDNGGDVKEDGDRNVSFR